MNDVKKSNTTFKLSSRLLALFLTLAMIVGVMPAAFADGESGGTGSTKTSYGTVQFQQTTSEGVITPDEVKTKDYFTLAIQASYSDTSDPSTAYPRIYLTGDTNTYNFRLLEMDGSNSKTIDGVTYTIKTDNGLGYDGTTSTGRQGQKYIEISQLTSGQTVIVGLEAYFNNDAKDGHVFTAVICDGNGVPMTSSNTRDNTDTIKATEGARMSNTVAANPKSIALDQSTTTVPLDDITWTIGEKIHPDDLNKDNTGVAKITGYDATDTIKLPNGITVDTTKYSGELSDADAAALFSGLPEGAKVNVKSPTEIEITWSVRNDENKSFEEQSIPITMRGSEFLVDPSYQTGEIENVLTTVYWTETESEDKRNETSPARDTVTVSRNGSGIESASKKVNYFEPIGNDTARINKDWAGTINGYVVEGDVIEYEMKVKNDSTKAITYTVTDDLTAAGLSFVEKDSWGGTGWSIAGTNVTNGTVEDVNGGTLDGSGKVKFTFTITGKNEATIKFRAKVAEDTERYITNTATVITQENVEMPVTSETVEEKKKTADIELSKDCDLPDRVFPENVAKIFNYTIKVSNKGSKDAENVSIEDILPAEIKTAFSIPYFAPVIEGSNGAVYSGVTWSDSSTDSELGSDGRITGTINKIPAYGYVTITVPVEVNSDADSITNTATVQLGNETPKTSSVTINKNVSSTSKLYIRKTNDKEIVHKGEKVTYTIEITNHEQGEYEGTFYVQEAIPAGLTITGFTPENVTSGTVTREEDNNGKAVFKLDNVTIKGSGSQILRIKIDALVGDGVDVNKLVYNTATITEDSTGTVPCMSATDKGIIVPGDTDTNTSPLQVEKTLENGVFKVRITNNGTAPVTDFDMLDVYSTEKGAYQDWGQNIAITALSNATYMGQGSVDQLGTWRNDRVVNPDGSNAGVSIQDNVIAQAFANSENSAMPPVLYHVTFVSKSEADQYKIVRTEEKDGSNVITRSDVNNGLAIYSGGYVEFTYNKAGASLEGSNTVIISYDGGSDASTVTWTDKQPDPTPGSDPVETPNPIKLTMTKDGVVKGTTNDSITISAVKSTDEATKDIKDRGIYDYTVILKNDSGHDYTTTGAIFNDVIPSGFALSILSSEYGTYSGDPADKVISITNYSNSEDNIHWWRPINIEDKATVKVGEITLSSNSRMDLQTALGYTGTDQNNAKIYNVVNPIVEGSNLIISFNESITVKNGGYITITYSLTPTDAEVASIISERSRNDDRSFDDRTYKNEMTFTGSEKFKTDRSDNTNTITAVDNVRILSEKIHPGITKTPYGYMGEETDQGGVTLYTGQPVGPGNTLIWKVNVYNNKDAGGAGGDMYGYTVTDTIPDGYNYHSYNYGTYTAIAYKTDEDGNKTGNNLTYPNATVSEDGRTVTFDTTGEEYRLTPGQGLEFFIVTTADSGNNESKVYKNKVTLNVGDLKLDADAVVSGDKTGDNEIGTSGDFPLYQVGTTSKKSVKKLSDQTYKVTSEEQGDKRRLETEPGDIINYKLEVKNNGGSSNNFLEDFAIIDRLPYDNDTGVITDGSRGSKNRVKYYSKIAPVAKVYNGNNLIATWTPDDHLDVMYSSDTKHVFDPKDLDWGAGITNGSVGWSYVSDDSTTLIRFAIKNTDTLDDTFKKTAEDGRTVYGIPTGARIEIEFAAQVPEYVEHTGTEFNSWNTFAYYFNSNENENMVAEPAKIGTYVEDKSYGGAIIVKKRFKTTVTGSARTFYFAIYQDTPYPQNTTQYAKPIELTITGSDQFSEAEGYFTGLNKGHRYYIYECRPDGTPIVGSNAYKDEKNRDVKDASYTDGDSLFTFKFDTSDQISVINGDTEKQQLYNGPYLVWVKDIDPNENIESATFTNMFEEDVQKEIFGPLYADVAKSQKTANDNKEKQGEMYSSRPDGTYNAADEMPEQATSDRASTEGAYKSYGEGTDYGSTVRFGGDQDHTIATGFLAKITGVGDYTINKINWNVTFNKSTFADKQDPSITYQRGNSTNDANDPGVFVRLRTVGASSSEGEEVSFFNVSEYMADVYSNSADEAAEAIGNIENESSAQALENEDAISFGEDESEGVMGDVRFSPYTMEEKIEMFVMEQGWDPDSIIYDEFGEAWMGVSSSGELMSADKSQAIYDKLESKEKAKFADNDLDGYTIYKLGLGKEYTVSLTDVFPRVTLAKDSEVYVGLIIDQLYDRHATAELQTSNEYEFSDTMAEEAAQFAPENHTLVASPLWTNNGASATFEKGKTVYRLKAGDEIAFDDDEVEKKEYTSLLATDKYTVSASSNKPITIKNGSFTINNESYGSVLSLGGSGKSDFSYRTLAVNADAGQKLTIYAVSGQAPTTDETKIRTLTVTYKNGKNEDGSDKWEKVTITPPAKAQDAVDHYDWNDSQVTINAAGPVYIYSNNSGIDIYKITVE